MDRVLNIEVTDAAGYESDELTISLDDAHPQIARPREGAELALSLGFAETGLIFIGTYIFEEIERNGYEQTVTLIAKAADHAKTLKEPKTRNWDKKTFGEILETIAKEHNLKPIVADKLASHLIAYVAQTEESDQHFLTRLGKRIGAVVAPKDGHLLATERHSGKTASGKDMPTIIVTKGKLISDGAYYVRLKPRSRFSKVRALYEDTATRTTKEIVLQIGDEGPLMTLRNPFQSAIEARQACEAKRRELRAGEGELSFDMLGEPTARAEMPISVLNVALDADGDWISSNVTHRWDYSDGGGATTTVEAQFGMDDKKKKKPKSKPTGDYVSILDR